MASENAKIGMAVVGGYVLGRTKKGRAAIRVAMWLTGNKGLVQGTVGQVAKSPEATQLVGQLQGPLREALTKAVLSTATSRMGALSGALTKRTEILSTTTDLTEGLGGKVSETGHKAVGAVGKTAGTVTSATKRRRKPKSEQADEAAEQEQGEDTNGDDEQAAGEDQSGDQHDSPDDDPDRAEFEAWKAERAKKAQDTDAEEAPAEADEGTE